MYAFNPEKMKKQAKAEGPGLGFKPRSAAHAQALNQAPDTIPGMFKPGEFVLPPDTVHAMGGPEVLQGIVDATHTPAPDVAVVPKGFQPKAFFAQGGSVDDEVSRQKANSFGDASAAAADPAVRQIQPAPNSPSNIFPGNRTQGASGFSGAPVGQAAQPPAVPAAPSVSPSNLYMQDRAQELKDQWGQGQYAQAAGTAARTAVQGAGMYALEAGDKMVSPWIDAAKGFGRGLFGADANAALAPAASTPAAAPAAQPATAATNPTDTRLAAGTQTAPASTPNPAPAPTADASAGKQVMPGVYSHGPGQYSDSAQGMGFKPGFTGQPSAQNLAAADNLSRGFNPSARPADPGPALGFGTGSELARVQAPTVLHSGNSWQARNDLRNLEVAASSITNQPGFRDTTQAWSTRRSTSGGQTPATSAYKAALEADIAARGMQPAYDMKAAQENAATQRTGMQEQGANAREAGRNALTAEELGLKREAQGFQTRAAKRLEDLQNRYLAAKTPEERTAIAQQLRELQGKADEANARMEVVRGSVDPTTGEREGDYAVIFDPKTQTARAVQVDSAAKAAPPAPTDASKRVVGQTYTAPNGQTVRWSGAGWAPV